MPTTGLQAHPNRHGNASSASVNIRRTTAAQHLHRATTDPNRFPHEHSKMVYTYQDHHHHPDPRIPLTSPSIHRVAENSHMLKPPINNYCVYSDPLTVMIVGGPNERTDYHINTTPEWFYQHKGSMLLKIVDVARPPAEQFVDIHIHEGDMFLLPANVPHNPVRFKDTVGVVIEQPRPEGSVDRLRWYCQSCGEQVHEAAFHCTDLGSQIKDAVNAFKADLEKRKCGNCGTLCDTAPPPKA